MADGAAPATPKPPSSPLTKCVQIMVAVVALVAYALNQDGTGGMQSSGLVDLFNDIQSLAGQDVGVHGHGYDSVLNDISAEPNKVHDENTFSENMQQEKKQKKHNKHKKKKKQESHPTTEHVEVELDSSPTEAVADEDEWEVVGAPKKPKRQQHHAPEHQIPNPRLQTAPADTAPGPGTVQITDAPGYYSSISASAVGTTLKRQLQQVVGRHTKLEYHQVWEALESMDAGAAGCSRSDVKDVYSGRCWPARRKRCGREEVSAEGQCYNREHTWPQSWWGGEEGRATTDLVHIFLADGWMNKQRSNLPLGEVSEVHLRSNSGAKVGVCRGSASLPRKGSQWEQGTVKFFKPEKGFGFVERVGGGEDVFLHGSHVKGGTPSAGDMVEFRTVQSVKGEAAREAVLRPSCFEPPDDFKGDLARVFFYMSLAYEGEFNCCAFSGVDSAHINTWLEDLLREWHDKDPVSGAEIERNRQIYSWQRNRNPFVDHPAWVKLIEDF